MFLLSYMILNRRDNVVSLLFDAESRLGEILDNRVHQQEHGNDGKFEEKLPKGLDRKQSHYAQELKMDVPCIIRKDLKEEWQIEEQLISDNLLRRHLSDYQKVECDDKLKNIEDIKAKLRKLSTLKRGDKLPDTQNFGERDNNKHSGESLQKRAKKLGTNRETLRQARKIYHEAPEPIKKEWQQKNNNGGDAQ